LLSSYLSPCSFLFASIYYHLSIHLQLLLPSYFSLSSYISLPRSSRFLISYLLTSLLTILFSHLVIYLHLYLYLLSCSYSLPSITDSRRSSTTILLLQSTIISWNLAIYLCIFVAAIYLPYLFTCPPISCLFPIFSHLQILTFPFHLSSSHHLIISSSYLSISPSLSIFTSFLHPFISLLSLCLFFFLAIHCYLLTSLPLMSAFPLTTFSISLSRVYAAYFSIFSCFFAIYLISSHLSFAWCSCSPNYCYLLYLPIAFLVCGPGSEGWGPKLFDVLSFSPNSQSKNEVSPSRSLLFPLQGLRQGCEKAR